MCCQNSISVFHVGDFTIRVNMDRITNNNGTVDYDCFCSLRQQPQLDTFYKCLFNDVYGFEPGFLEWDDETMERWLYEQDFLSNTPYGFMESGLHNFYGYTTHQPAFRFTISLHEEIPNFPFGKFFNRIIHPSVIEEPEEHYTHYQRESIYYANPHKVSVSSDSIHVLR